MNCLKCGSEINDSMQVCASCGLPLTAEALTKSGKPLRSGWIAFFSIWNFLIGSLTGLSVLVFLIMLFVPNAEAEVRGIFIFVVLLLGGFAAVSIWCGTLLWTMKPKARIVQIVLACFWLFLGFPLNTIFGIIALVYLNNPDIKALFTEKPLEGLSQQEVMRIAVKTGSKVTAVIIAVLIAVLVIPIIGIIASIAIPNLIVAKDKA